MTQRQPDGKLSGRRTLTCPNPDCAGSTLTELPSDAHGSLRMQCKVCGEYVGIVLVRVIDIGVKQAYNPSS